MPDIPEAAVRAAAEAMQEEEDTRTYPTALTLARIALEAAAPAIAAQERADERRKVAEEIAAALLAVDPVEWALAGQHAGQDAARIAHSASLPERGVDGG